MLSASQQTPHRDALRLLTICHRPSRFTDAVATPRSTCITACLSAPSAVVPGMTPRPGARSAPYRSERKPSLRDASARWCIEATREEVAGTRSSPSLLQTVPVLPPLRCLLQREVDRDGHDNRHGHAVQEGRRIFPLPHGLKRGLIEHRHRA